MPFGLDFSRDSETQASLSFSRYSRSSFMLTQEVFLLSGCKGTTFSGTNKTLCSFFQFPGKKNSALDTGQIKNKHTPYYIY